MADITDSATRSRMMGAIKGKNTLPELSVRRALHARGFRYRLHDKSLPGKPDIILPMYKYVIFVHGCFWHGHANCKYFVVPKTRTAFWLNKIENNQTRDNENYSNLTAEKWKIILIFECQLKKSTREQTLKNILTELRK